MFIATDLEFIIFNNIFLIENKEIDEFEFYKGRSSWEMFSMYVFWEYFLFEVNGTSINFY